MNPNIETTQWLTRIVTQDHDGTAAQGILSRYRKVYRSPAIVSAILRLAHDWQADPLAAGREFESKRLSWENEGAFLEMLRPEEVDRWINSEEYVVAEAAPCPVKAGDRFEAVAQRIYRLPGSEWVIPVLEAPGNEIYDRRLYDEIAEAGPLATASFDYGGVVPAWGSQGAAGAVRHAGFTELLRRAPAADSASDIRFLAGWVFAIQGLVLYDTTEKKEFGDRLTLERFAQPPIMNRRSLETNLGSRRMPATLLGLRRDTLPVPVILGQRRYGLDVHWYVLVVRADEIA